LPPVVTSTRAWSAIFFAAAFCSSVGSVLPLADLRLDRDDPGVALLGRRRLLDDLRVDLVGRPR
jgi:hypothetical protein